MQSIKDLAVKKSLSQRAYERAKKQSGLTPELQNKIAASALKAGRDFLHRDILTYESQVAAHQRQLTELRIAHSQYTDSVEAESIFQIIKKRIAQRIPTSLKLNSTWRDPFTTERGKQYKDY